MKVTVAIFLVYTICISSGKDPKEDIFVSQRPGSIDEVACGTSQMPCLTISYASGLCSSQCTLSIDGGTQTKQFEYYLNDNGKIDIGGVVWHAKMKAFDSNFRPIIVNNKTNPFSNDSFVNMTVREVFIDSIIFIDRRNSNATITLSSGVLFLKNCFFTNVILNVLTKYYAYPLWNKIHIEQSQFTGSFINIQGSRLTFLYASITHVNFSESSLQFHHGGVSLDYCHFLYSVLHGIEEDFVILTKNIFYGSFKAGTSNPLPQVYLEKSSREFKVFSSIFSNATNGVIESENTGSFLLKDSEIRDNKREFMSLMSVVHFTNGDGRIINCTFQNNISPLFEGGSLLYEETDAKYVNHIELGNLTVSNKYDNLALSPIKISCNSNPISFPSMNTFFCPPNTCLKIMSDQNTLQYFCLNCQDDKYSLQQSYLTVNEGLSNDSNIFHITNARRIPCSPLAICLSDDVRSKRTYWAITGKDAELKFFKCPAYYCCSSEESCVSYNTCNNNRGGRLCGNCLNGYVLSIFSQNSCINGDDCETLHFLYVCIFVGTAIFIAFLYIDKWFTVFSYLEKPIKTTRNRRRCNDVVPGEQIDIDVIRRCHDGPEQHLPASIRPEKPCTVNGMIKILFCFYQIVAIIQVQKSHSSTAFVFTEIIVSFFTMKIQIPSLNLNVCTMISDDAVTMETIKTSVLFLCFSLCILAFVCCFIKYITHYVFLNPEKEPLRRRFHVKVIDKTTNSYIVLPIIVRIKLAYIQFLLLGYTVITMLLLKSVHCIQILDEFYLYIQSSRQCFQSGDQFVAMVFIILWSLLFPISIFVGVQLLRECKITPNSFLFLLSFPPALIWYLVKPKLVQVERRLGNTQATLAYHMIEVLNQPFKTKIKTENNAGVEEYQFNWEPVLIFRRLILLLISVFVLSSMTRLFLIELALGLFLFHNLLIMPYKTERLNVMDVICKISLMLFAIADTILNESYTNTKLAVFLGVFLTLVPIFALFIFAVINYEEKHSIFKRFILRKVD